MLLTQRLDLIRFLKYLALDASLDQKDGQRQTANASSRNKNSGLAQVVHFLGRQGQL